MPAIWTTPRTWAMNELVTESLLNQQLRDNLEYLSSRPFAEYQWTSSYTTTSTSFIAVDSTNLRLSLTTNGGDVLVLLAASASNNTSGADNFLDVAVNGVRKGGVNGIYGFDTASTNNPFNVSVPIIIDGLAAGSHTFELQWRTSAGTLTLNSYGRFSVKEI